MAAACGRSRDLLVYFSLVAWLPAYCFQVCATAPNEVREKVSLCWVILRSVLIVVVQTRSDSEGLAEYELVKLEADALNYNKSL